MLGVMLTRRALDVTVRRKCFTPGEHAWVTRWFGKLTRPEDWLMQYGRLAAV